MPVTSDVAWWVELPAYQAQSPRFSPQHRMKMRSVPVISAFGKQRQKDQKFSYSALNGEPEEILGRGRARGERERKEGERGNGGGERGNTSTGRMGSYYLSW